MKTILIIVAICLSGIVNAQETLESAKTIENQFDNLYKKSSSYQEYKVISKELFQNLKLQTLDSIELYKKQLAEEKALLKIEKLNLSSLKAKESKTQTALKNAIQNENTVSLFGSPVSLRSHCGRICSRFFFSGGFPQNTQNLLVLIQPPNRCVTPA